MGTERGERVIVLAKALSTVSKAADKSKSTSADLGHFKNYLCAVMQCNVKRRLLVCERSALATIIITLVSVYQ